MDETPLSDADLLRRHVQGDAMAFSTLRDRYVRLVYSACRRATGDATLAEDAAQGVFLLLNAKAKSLTGHTSLAGWLFQSARLVSQNLLREERRRSKREQKAFAPPIPEEGDWNVVGPLIDTALGDLKPDEREAILLRFVQDRSLAEVGAALGVAENTARMRVSRAVDRLRENLRRAGVAVSAVALTAMLSTRMADAEAPPLTGKPSQRAARLARRAGSLIVLSVAWKAALVGVAIVGVAGFAVWTNRSHGLHRVEPAEAARIFKAAQGRWSGTLDYADDRTGKRFKYSTQVTVTGDAANLRFTARYTGASNVDETTFARLPDGRYSIGNGGANSSHALDGTYDFVRLSNGYRAFIGFSPFRKANVRLRIVAKTGSLILQEEYQRPSDRDYQFRNQFTLNAPTKLP